MGTLKKMKMVFFTPPNAIRVKCLKIEYLLVWALKYYAGDVEVTKIHNITPCIYCIFMQDEFQDFRSGFRKRNSRGEEKERMEINAQVRRLADFLKNSWRILQEGLNQEYGIP